MREIKFRGRLKTNNKWIYGDLAHLEGVPCIQTDVSDKEKRSTIGWNVDPDTVGQFTGLYDKNRKEIYEGDIVRMHTIEGGIYIVSYEDSHIGAFSLISPRTKCFVGIFGRDYDFEPFYCAVIGNIYDNPDLLSLTD